jgi:chemotaxis protein MotB
MSGGMPHKKGGHEEGGGHAPAWIVSFADMVILLMSFFVLLLATSSQKTATDEDLLKILASVKVGFGYMPRPNSTDPLDIAAFQVLSQRKRASGGSGNQWQQNAAIDGSKNKERDTWLKAQATLGRPVYFAANSIKVPTTAASDLDEIAALIRHHYRAVVVQGHCSPDEAKQDPTEGHDLAFRRAVALKKALEDRGVAASRLRLVTCSFHAVPPGLESKEKQLAVVTMGNYLLPSEGNALAEPSIPTKQTKNLSGPHP